MPATAATIAPPVVVLSKLPDAIEEMAKEVVVALVSNVLPPKVVEARMLASVELKAPATVVDPAANTLPMFEMLKRVEVAKVVVDEAIEKSVVGEVPVVEDATNSERSAVGDEVPMPTLPLAKKVVVAVPPKEARVEEK